MPARRLILLVTLFAVLAVAVTAAYLQRSVPATQGAWPRLPYQSEDEYIVSQTAVSVIDLAQYARSSAPEPLSKLDISHMRVDPGLAISFRVGARDVSISLKTHVWDPEAYVELARSEGASAGASGAPDNDDVVAALLDLNLAVLRLQNDTVSIALKNDYRNPANHEAASLLLGVFALREAAGYFYDPRLVLSRSTAHLAIARAMRGTSSQPSEAGALAAILIDVNAGRMGPAMKALDVFERTWPSPATRAWSRTLRRRATLDWRVPVADDAPLVERLEYMRSLARMISDSRSLEYLSTRNPEAVPDWGWRTMDFPMTVANGNVFVRDTISRTLDEAGQVLRLSSYSRSEVAAALSREPAVSSIGRSASRGIEVIDGGTWSAFYQRELAHVAMNASEFYRNMLRLPDDAREFEDRIDAIMGGTPLWPIVRRLRFESECRCGFSEGDRAEIEATYRATMARVLPLIQEKPQTVPFLAWSWVAMPPQTIRAIDTPPRSLWFRPIFPTGTVFESRRINGGVGSLPHEFVAQADAFHELSPWDPVITINWSIVRCFPNRCTPEQERANFANIADYSLTTMRKFAGKGPDPLPSLRELCRISASDCYTLGDWFLIRDRFSEAAAAFQDFFDRELDRVNASNNAEWLVRYYQKTGRQNDALRIAKAAADIGSALGMRSLAGVLERQGDLASAEALYRRIFDRYDDGTRLLAFALRRADATGTPPAMPQYSLLMNRYFGGELEHVTTASLTGPPEKGLHVHATCEWGKHFGFRRGDIIVALDGVRLWTHEQEQILYARSFEPRIRYTVWRDNKYVDVEGPFRQYLYGPSFTDEFLSERGATAASH